ncbi:unnamed protein product [Cylicostephanus goldi]|uniref:Immunoglobulin I-set domain-containing protein n=1 Tax=Cylicostephanus goldi TaxID=71465 RepID=A0A3P6QRX6_CYLGO|nr:unnamed protein product [Cylicostephanus goldi]
MTFQSQTVSGQYHNVHVLEIRRVTKEHYGNYRCTARNDNGIHFADIDVAESEQKYLYTNAIQEVNSSDDEGSDKDIVDGDDEDAAEEEEQSDTQPIRSKSYPSPVTQVFTTSSSAEGMFSYKFPVCTFSMFTVSLYNCCEQSGSGSLVSFDTL